VGSGPRATGAGLPIGGGRAFAATFMFCAVAVCTNGKPFMLGVVALATHQRPLLTTTAARSPHWCGKVGKVFLLKSRGTSDLGGGLWNRL
jgi:hypothetical protein